jgi:nucleoside-diphosphate-sugar epimerase
VRVIISGALGYVGSRLIRSAWPRPVEQLVLIDNLSTHGQASLFDLDPAVPVTFIQGDVRSLDLEPVIGRGDVVLHLAAITGSEARDGDPAFVDEVNVAAAGRVAHVCAERQARLLLMSSTSVYGCVDGAVDESTDLNLAPPETHYAATKLRAEQLIASIAAQPPLRYVVARCGTIFGPSAGMRFHTAISKFCWQAAMGEPLTVWPAAMQQRRPYLDIDDAIRAIHFLIDRDMFDRRTFNVVTSTATVRDVVGCIKEVVPEVRVSTVESPAGTARSQIVSCARLEAEGFDFRGDLRDGIHRTLTLLNGLQLSRRLHERR